MLSVFCYHSPTLTVGRSDCVYLCMYSHSLLCQMLFQNLWLVCQAAFHLWKPGWRSIWLNAAAASWKVPQRFRGSTAGLIKLVDMFLLHFIMLYSVMFLGASMGSTAWLIWTEWCDVFELLFLKEMLILKVRLPPLKFTSWSDFDALMLHTVKVWMHLYKCDSSVMSVILFLATFRLLMDWVMFQNKCWIRFTKKEKEKKQQHFRNGIVLSWWCQEFSVKHALELLSLFQSICLLMASDIASPLQCCSAVFVCIYNTVFCSSAFSVALLASSLLLWFIFAKWTVMARSADAEGVFTTESLS